MCFRQSLPIGCILSFVTKGETGISFHGVLLHTFLSFFVTNRWCGVTGHECMNVCYFRESYPRQRSGASGTGTVMSVATKTCLPESKEFINEKPFQSCFLTTKQYCLKLIFKYNVVREIKKQKA